MSQEQSALFCPVLKQKWEKMKEEQKNIVLTSQVEKNLQILSQEFCVRERNY